MKMMTIMMMVMTMMMSRVDQSRVEQGIGRQKATPWLWKYPIRFNLRRAKLELGPIPALSPKQNPN